MSVTLIVTNPKFSFPRSYLKGFVGSAGTSSLIINGQDVEFDYLAPLYHIVLHMTDGFFPPTSNVYSLDHLFDATASQVYLSGVPIPAGVGVLFFPMTVEPTWRVQVLATLPVDETVTVDLQPLSNYWRLPV